MDPAAGRSLVQRWREAARPEAAPPPGPAELTTAQRGVLVFERLHPATPVFNVHFAARHDGPLDEPRLDAALAAVVARHPALRTTFADGERGPIPVVHETADIRIRWTDVRDLPPSHRWDAALARAERAVSEPFDLEHGPLVRFRCVRLGDDERLLIFVAHHLICDGASMQVLLADLRDAYDGGLAQTAPVAEPLVADPAALQYWKDQLAGLPELDLPTDRLRPARPGFQAGTVAVDLPADVVAAAENLGRQENATLFMVVLAAFQLLLGEYSGQDDFAVGVPEAGRSTPGRRAAVGLLSDLLVLRADLSGRPTFRELVRRTRAASLAAFDHRGVPFEDVAAALNSGRQHDGVPVRANLAFHGDWGTPTLGGSALKRIVVRRAALRQDVDLHLWRERGGLSGVWDFSAEAFDPATAERMAERLTVLLTRAAADPDSPVDTLDPLIEGERERLELWGRGPLTDDPDVTLVELFAAQVARTPNAPAIEDARRRLTYRELDERSDRLAHLLHERGVAAGDIVGIRLGRSVDLAVAMLGIQKAGAAYLPLDPAYPADRIEYMLTDSSATFVVTAAELAELDSRPTATPTLNAAAPNHLAYVLYTSGSTGRPKGVHITHRNAVPMVLWGRRFFTPHEISRVLAATSVCFDVSVFEFFGTLCAGGTVVVVENALALLTDPPDVTMVCAVPSAARTLVAADAFPPSVRVVGLGGEPVTGTLVEDLHATGHIEAVINLYGPTEDTTYSTWARLQPEEQPPPIGVLLPHGRGHVLDRALRRAPIGAVGELYLAGRGVSRGYGGRPGLTATRYVPDPYAQTPGERMYRTGDLVRYRADGALLYLGRRDFQIKVRGQRIELGEIENTLQRHPDVHEAVVALRDDRLVGYVTARRPGELDLDDVRRYLRASLPVIMVPASLLLLDALPQTPNGKVNRLALPEPSAPASSGGGELPTGWAEELVAEVWQQVLDVDRIGRDDDFFDLGGDSLSAGEVISGLRTRAGVGVDLRLVFEHSRLVELAAALEAAGTTSPEAQLAPRRPEAEPVLSYEQQRLWLECQIRPNAAYNIHGRHWLQGNLDPAVLERGIRAIIERHESLRTTFELSGGRLGQRVSPPNPHWRLNFVDLVHDGAPDPDVTALRMADELAGDGARDPDAAALRMADEQAATVFDLARGPLFSTLLVRVAEDRHLLSMTIHHIVADGLSVGLILRELSALYRTGGDAARAELPQLPVQYRDYAVWQRSYLAGDNLASRIEYWRDRLAGAPRALTLPAARRRAASQGTVGGKVTVQLKPQQAAALHRLCREHEVTPFMAVLAAVTTVLRRWSGQEDVVVGVPVNTRGASGTEALVGLFVNTVPLRVGFGGDPVFAEVLDRVRKAALDGYVNHADTPFEALVGQLRPPRDPSRTPVFQVLVNMVESAEGEWRLPGVSVTTPELPAQTSKFDLDLSVLHQADDYRFDLLYHADRYEDSAMRAFVDQVLQVLAAAAQDATRGVLDYDLSSGNLTRSDSARRDAAVAGLDDLAARDLGLGPDDRLAFVGGGPRLRLFATTLASTLGVPLKDSPTADHAASSAADDAARLAWLRETSPTVAFLTGPVLRTLTPESGPALSRLRLAFLLNDGDLLAHDVERIRRLVPGCRVVAVYLPDESGRSFAAYEVPARWLRDEAPLRVPVGEAVGRTMILRNSAGTPAAVGEVGRAAGLAAPMRRRPDGVLEFAGPSGVDPLEAVAALRDFPGVLDAVLVEDIGEDGEAAFTAYVADPDGVVDQARLRQHLVTALPSYLIPRTVTVVPRIALDAAGNYDLAALSTVIARRG